TRWSFSPAPTRAADATPLTARRAMFGAANSIGVGGCKLRLCVFRAIARDDYRDRIVENVLRFAPKKGVHFRRQDVERQSMRMGGLPVALRAGLMFALTIQDGGEVHLRPRPVVRVPHARIDRKRGPVGTSGFLEAVKIAFLRAEQMVRLAKVALRH